MRPAREATRGDQRILEAAITLFGRSGVTGTSLRAVAEEAGVSQALVIHHFGSKDGLRRACDRHVAAVVRANKQATLTHGPQLDPFHALRQLAESQPLLRYLARSLTEGGEHTAALVDEFVADAAEYMRAGEEAGYLKTSATPRERTITLVIWSLGALAMHEHVRRLLGVDFLDGDAPPESLGPYLRPMLELFTQGLMQEGAFDQMADIFDTAAHPPTEQRPDDPSGPPSQHQPTHQQPPHTPRTQKEE